MKKAGKWVNRLMKVSKGRNSFDVADIATVIDIMAGKIDPDAVPDNTPEGVESVDLGLPSGTLRYTQTTAQPLPAPVGEGVGVGSVSSFYGWTPSALVKFTDPTPAHPDFHVVIQIYGYN